MTAKAKRWFLNPALEEPIIARAKKWISIMLPQFIVLVWLAITIYPFFWFILLSFKTQVQAFSIPPVWIFKPTLKNYQALVEVNFFRFFKNSTIVSLSTMVVALAVGVPTGYALSRIHYRLRRGLMLWVLIIRMVPGMAYVIPYFVGFQRVGLLDTPVALTIIYTPFVLALVMWTMQAFFEELPHELEESAWIDGASLFQTFIWVVLPLVGPGLIATAILCFLFAWNEFLFALVITRSAAMTLPVAVTGFLTYEGSEWGRIAASTVILLIPVMAFAVGVRKYLVRGILAGAMKG